MKFLLIPALLLSLCGPAVADGNDSYTIPNGYITKCLEKGDTTEQCKEAYEFYTDEIDYMVAHHKTKPYSVETFCHVGFNTGLAEFLYGTQSNSVDPVMDAHKLAELLVKNCDGFWKHRSLLLEIKTQEALDNAPTPEDTESPDDTPTSSPY